MAWFSFSVHKLITLLWSECLCSPPPPPTTKFMCWDPNANMVVLGDRAFEKYLGLEGGDLVNGICALIKKDPTELTSPFYNEHTQQEVCNPEDSPHLTMLAS